MTESAIAATSTTLPVLPDDCIYEVFQHLSAKDLANASKTCRAWNKLSEKNSLWQQLCLERWRTWPPPPPFSSYYDDNNQYQGIHRSLNGMSLLNNHSQDDYYINTRMGSSTTSSSSKYPSPLEKLPDMHQPSQWYSTSHPPYELDCWKEVFRERQEKDHIVRMLLDEMVEDSRNRMRHMDGIAGIGMAHARDVLENIIHGRNGEVKDLSRTYYAQKTLKRLQRGWVLDQWRGYRSGHQSFPVWQGCGLMAMFSDQTMELTDLDRQFQELADEFLAVSPIHGRGDTSGGLGSAGSSAYGEDGLDGLDSRSATTTVPPVYVSSNYYHTGIDRYSPGSLMDTSSTSSGRWPISPDRTQERIDETNERYQRHYDAQLDRLRDLIRFFTLEKGFKGNTENYYDPFNSFIDKVLTRKVGIPMSLCIVFAELAERVGVHGVELMGFPQHFMLRHRPLVLGAGGHHGSPLLGSHDGAGPPAPPTHFLDLFHPPYRLLPMDEYEDYFASLNIPRPMNIYRDLPTPPLEIFLRCLRNIVLAVEQTGGAGRIGYEHQSSLYSGITQLLALHPIEEWGLYVLWLKYLGNFWPEDVGFVRTAIEDMELSDHRRMAGRKTSASPTQQQQQRPHHTYVRGRGGLQAAAGSASHYTSSTQETVKILRAHVRELEMADEAGEVGEIRRRRRPKVAAAASNYSPLATSSASLSPDLPRLSSSVQNPTTSTSHPGQRRGSVSASEVLGPSASPTTASASSPTMDNHVLHAHHQYLRQDSISGEQQNVSSSSMNSGVPSEEDENGVRPPMRVASMFGGEERRRPEPEYYVGEVFRHLIYRYTGVIYGYDLKCEAEEGWIRSMGIDLLPHGRHQPFYKALLSDGLKRYVAQENIQVLFREYRQGGSGGTDAGSSSLADGSAADQIPLDLAAMLTAAGATPVSVPADGGNIDASATAAGSDLDVVVVEGSDSGSSDTPQAPATAEDTTGAVNSDDPATSTASEPAPASTTPAPLPSTGTASGTTTAAPAVTPGGTPSVLSNMTFTIYNVEFSELGPLDIEAAGQYFEAWDNKHGHYVMNKELRKVYPTEDYL
ncbi:hypothetical protein BGX30_015245 [Mortierella sp. GBA39]|nr:hypothetical protein BGX30_015245 [Mortierella sp. GBA39]